VPRTGHETEVSGLEYVNSSSRRMGRQRGARIGQRVPYGPSTPSRFPLRV
jgi:hypothetical protein